MLGYQGLGVSDDADEEDAHQDERQGSCDRIIEVLEELQLNDVADHRGTGSSEDRSVDVVAHSWHEGEQDPANIPGIDSGRMTWVNTSPLE